MGIYKFSDFIKDHAPNCYFEVPLESFRGKRFAIDMDRLIHSMTDISSKEVVDQTDVVQNQPDRGEINRKTLDRIIINLEVYLRHGITPVCIFDSKSHPLKGVGKTKLYSKKNREKARNKLIEIENRLYAANVLERESLKHEYIKSYKGYLEVPRDFINQLKDILSSVGFPVFSAEDFNLLTRDAEGICASLCINGNDYCFAGVTDDTDFHLYGGNYQIIEVYNKIVTVNGVKNKVYYAKVRVLENIIKESGLSFNVLRDGWIMHGTDYNLNVPGIGPKKIWKLLKQYGSIANMAAAGIDVSILNYNEVLPIFNSTITKLNIQPPDFNQELFKQNARNVFELYGLKDHTSIIADDLNNFNVVNLVVKSINS